jgi:hypothetical protein
MPTLNRFPLLGLWAREAARRLGYANPEADALGHAYAVLYAIRANMRPEPSQPGAAAKPKRRLRADQIEFGGDKLDVVYDESGRLLGRVGGDRPQTPRSYRTSSARKFPEGYLERVTEAFQKVLDQIPPEQLDGPMIYDVYDQWKKEAGVGRRVDLDRLIEWCQLRAGALKAARPRKRQAAAGTAAKRSRKSRASSKAAPSTSLLK